jgi:hypothetical protein
MPRRNAAYVIEALEKAHATLISAAAFPSLMVALQPFVGAVKPFLNEWHFRVPNKGASMPESRDLGDMLRAFAWVDDIPPRNPVLRRLVILRSMTAPGTGKPMAWAKIGRILGANDVAVKTWHSRAIGFILTAFERENISHDEPADPNFIPTPLTRFGIKSL